MDRKTYDGLFGKDGEFDNKAILSVMDKMTAEDFKKFLELAITDADGFLALLEEIFKRPGD